jgi:hypothetical protein
MGDEEEQRNRQAGLLGPRTLETWSEGDAVLSAAGVVQQLLISGGLLRGARSAFQSTSTSNSNNNNAPLSN